MFSLQTIFGKGDKFYGLLEQSAEQACISARALNDMVTGKEAKGLPAFSASHQREKEIAAAISEELVNTFVTALDREDIEELSSALYKVPKTIQKFAERYVLAHERLGDINFSQRSGLLVSATDAVAEMVGELRHGLHLSRMKKIQDRLQAIEAEADRLLLEPYRAFYLESTDVMRTMLAKDLFELIEKAIDKCRDVGNVVYGIVLKNS
ncbi:MAG TPA: pit accessory protein [Rhodanobacteraceae bacterium]|nr:pit accessory protein [Rhodanobacteraceae bacterium]